MDVLVVSAEQRATEAGAPELTPVRVSSVLRNLEAAAIPDRDICIQLSLDDQLFINADEQLLTSALGNLLHNAIKFSPPGATISLGVHSSDGSAVIEVEDHCGGLKLADPSRFSSRSSSKRVETKTGRALGWQSQARGRSSAVSSASRTAPVRAAFSALGSR